MLFFRSLLYFLGSFIVAVTTTAIALILFFAPFKIRYFIISKWAIFCIWWLEISANVKLKIINKERIPNTPCIIISNHQSTYDTLVTQAIFPAQTWVLKRELLFVPIFGWGLALLKPIIINRGKKIQALRKVITQGADRIKQGIWVVIYPEGTRQPYNKLGAYQNGGAAIAKKANVDIVPIYHNAGKVWPKGSFIKHPGTVTIIIGEPINTEHQSAADITKKIRNWTQEQMLLIENNNK